MVQVANRIMISLMSEKWIAVEGADLAQALEKACSELGLTRENLEYDFDLNHFKGGASTVRILAGSKDPQAARLTTEIDAKVKKLLEAQNLDARVTARVTIFAVQIELRAPGPGVADHAFRRSPGLWAVTWRSISAVVISVCPSVGSAAETGSKAPVANREAAPAIVDVAPTMTARASTSEVNLTAGPEARARMIAVIGTKRFAGRLEAPSKR